MLTLGCWDQGISQFRIVGGTSYTNAGNEKPLKGVVPTSISFFSTGEVFALGLSDGTVNLYTKDAILIGPVCKHSDWVWAVSTRASQNLVISGSNSGLLRTHQILFPVVPALYKDRYAYRDQLTDIIIRHLGTDARVRIRCRDFVKKLALYKERLAVLLTDKIIVYSASEEDPCDMKYKAMKKIGYK